jgi:integrase
MEVIMNAQTASNPSGRSVWNKGKLVGQKAPLRLSEIWAIRGRLEIYERVRDLALFNLAIDSKSRGCDLVQLRLRDVANDGRVRARAIVMQQKIKQPVQFEITKGARQSLADWIARAELKAGDFLFPSRLHDSPTSFNQTVRPHCPPLVRSNWLRPRSLWHAHNAADEADANLSPHKEPQSGSAVAWSHPS